MWRRAPAQLQTLASSWRSALGHGGCTAGTAASSAETLRHRVLATFSSSLHSSPFQRTSPLFSSDAEKSDTVSKKRVEDVMPIATGLEREELEAELEGRRRFDMDAPVGPFGTKDADAWLGLILSAPCFFTDESSERQEAPAVIKSHFDKRIVGCPGGEGEDEHDVVWFWLEKGKPHECPVCSQYFVLEVIGPGGPPDGHGDDDDH